MQYFNILFVYHYEKLHILFDHYYNRVSHIFKEVSGLILGGYALKEQVCQGTKGYVVGTE